MADDPTTPEAEAKPEPEKKPDETPEVPAGAENPDAVRNAIKAERDAAKEAKKRAEAAEAKLAEIEEADKSEVEKAKGALTKAEERAATAEARLLRFEVAQEKDVPAKLVPLLTATTKEDLEAQADLILENAKPSEASEFDGGARKPAPEPQDPVAAHDAFITALTGNGNNP